MSAKTKLAITAFFAICGMGLFSALASGIHWGTPEAGATCFITFSIAIMAFMAAKADL
jgi:hypothetical protein